MAAHLTIQDIRQFPPEMQKQIMAELYPEPIPSPTHPAIPPAKPAEWWQIDGQPAKPVIGERIVPNALTQPTKPIEWWHDGASRRIVPQPKPLRRKKSKMLLWIILAYVLLIGACIIPGLIYQIK